MPAGLAGCGGDDEPSTIADHVRGDSRFSNLEGTLAAAEALATLDGDGPFTLFAATDDAFELLFDAYGTDADSLLMVPQLDEFARYHIHEGELTTSQLERLTAITSLSGQEIHVRYGLDGIELNDGATIGETIVADNGVIHVVDATLFRPLIAGTREYESAPDIVLAESGGEGLGITSDILTIADEGLLIHDLRLFIEIEHTDVSNLFVYLQNQQTGAFIRVLAQPSSRLDDINVVLADSASHDIVDDVVSNFDFEAQAFPESTYRPREPLEYMVGEPLAGDWELTVWDLWEGDTGRLVRWGLIATASVEPPEQAIVLDRRYLTSAVLPRGFTEAVPARFQPVGDLSGGVEIRGTAGELVADTLTLPEDTRFGSAMFDVPRSAEIGPREVVISARIGDVSRILSYDATVLEPDASGIELLAHVPLPRLGADGYRGSDIWGWTDPMTGAEIAIVGTSTGTAFVDVSAPESPVVLGTLPTETDASNWRDIKVYQDHAFIVSEAWDHGLQVFDLTQLRSATPGQTFVPTANSYEFGNAHNIAINEATGMAYVVGSSYDGCSGGLLTYDLTTPTAPVVVGCFSGGVPANQAPGPAFPTDVYIHDVQCVVYAGPDADYQGREVCLSSDETSIGVADVTDSSSPVQISRVTYEDVGYTHQGWLTEDHQYFIVNDEFDEFDLDIDTRSYVWDVRDLDNPTLIGTIENPRDAIGHNTYIVGDVAYQANYTSGLRLVDIGGIASGTGVETAYYDTYPNDEINSKHYCVPGTSCSVQSFRGAWSNYPFFSSGIIVVSDVDRGLFVLRPGGK
jgi:choice-of-anchor B domain-containing protein